MNTFFYIRITREPRQASPIYTLSNATKYGWTEWGPYFKLSDAVDALELIDLITGYKSYNYTIVECCIDEASGIIPVDDKVYGKIISPELAKIYSEIMNDAE